MTITSEEVRKLFVAGVHFGHKTQKWNPKMKSYLYGEKNGIHVFDLEKTAYKLKEAMQFVENSVAKGKVILLVSTKQQTKQSLPDLAMALDVPFVSERWFGGLLTNWKTTKDRIMQLRNLKEERDANNFAKYLKKERNKKMKQIKKLELWLAGIEKLNKKPDLVFVLDPVRDQIAVVEACKCHIPVVAVADSNANPDQIDYLIPGNDDAVKAINLILAELHDAIERGQKGFQQAKEEKPEQKKIN